MEKEKRTEIQSLSLIENYRDIIKLKLNEIKELRETIRKINKSI